MYLLQTNLKKNFKATKKKHRTQGLSPRKAVCWVWDQVWGKTGDRAGGQENAWKSAHGGEGSWGSPLEAVPET